MDASIKQNDRTRNDLSDCVERLHALLESVREQEAYLCDHRNRYFDETIVLAHSQIDGAMRALRGIIARLDSLDR